MPQTVPVVSPQSPPAQTAQTVQADAVQAAEEDYSQEWAIELSEVGDVKTAAYSCLCMPCALAEARSYMDESPPLFNILCLPFFCIAPQRWLLRTAYMIPGDTCGDLTTSLALPCCVANQMLQTAQQTGNVSIGGGYRFNRRPWRYDVGSVGESCGQCAVASVCCCAASGRALHNATGMPCLLGGCCVTPCAARNLVRYQYRLDGDDMLEEVSLPCTAALMATGAAYTPIAALPLLSLVSLQTDNEARHRSGGGKAAGYLSTKGLRPWAARRGRPGAGAGAARSEHTPLLAEEGSRGGSGRDRDMDRDLDRDRDKAQEAKVQAQRQLQKAASAVRRTRVVHPGEPAEEGEEEEGEEEEEEERQKLRQLVREQVYGQPAASAVPVDEYQAAVWANAESSYDLIA